MEALKKDQPVALGRRLVWLSGFGEGQPAKAVGQGAEPRALRPLWALLGDAAYAEAAMQVYLVLKLRRDRGLEPGGRVVPFNRHAALALPVGMGGICPSVQRSGRSVQQGVAP